MTMQTSAKTAELVVTEAALLAVPLRGGWLCRVTLDFNFGLRTCTVAAYVRRQDFERLGDGELCRRIASPAAVREAWRRSRTIFSWPAAVPVTLRVQRAVPGSGALVGG